MPCESCAVQFTMFKRKRVCCECDRYYCNNCLGRSVGVCGACTVLSSRPLGRHSLDHLRVRDLQCYLHRQNISTRGCVEKEDLVNLVLAHVNSGDFSRRAPPQHSQSDFSSTFASIKGFTSNLNNILSSAFDIGPDYGDRSHARGRQQNNGSRNPGRGGGTARQDNGPSSRSRMSPPASSTVPPVRTPTATTSPRMSPGTPNGGQFQSQPNSRVPTPITSPQQSTARQATGVPPNLSYAIPNATPNINISSTSRIRDDYSNLIPQCIVTDTSPVLEIVVPQVDDDSPLGQRNTTDCVEIEDLDDDDWEILGQIADPLPQESAEIISDASTPIPTLLRSTARATSEFNIPSRIVDDLSGESSSLKETKFCAPMSISKRIQLDDIQNLTEVENLNVKQLKELLILNRVDFKGCCERNELLERAKRLWRESTKSREDLEKASADELCKICMDAPMECVMLECGHIATCIACGKRLSECPICRQYVIRVVRFFRS